jgi:hypothetical protein
LGADSSLFRGLFFFERKFAPRINYKNHSDALRWLRDAKADTLLSELVVNPARPNRIEPHVIKRRMKEYTLMKKPRRKLRKALERKRHAA